MQYSYNYYSDSEEGLLAALLVYAITGLFSGGFGILLYVFRSLGVYSIAKRRGLNHPWFAWVPVVDTYLLGSLSDQYQYVVKGKEKNKRKWLLGLNIVMFALSVVATILLIGSIVSLTGNVMAGSGSAKLDRLVLKTVLGTAASFVPLAVVAVAAAVIRYVALYDVFASLDPRNSAMYIVLSILFRVTEPFFLFFNRSKDGGMPPRREAQPEVTWETPSAGPEGPWSDN